MAHLFEFNALSDSLRHLNRGQYKKTRRWLRICRNRIESEIDKALQMVIDASIYGIGLYNPKFGQYGKSPVSSAISDTIQYNKIVEFQRIVASAAFFGEHITQTDDINFGS